jgi:cytochrome c biogenesis protein CcmG/thiol:disulfide interchange protein DsbE
MTDESGFDEATADAVRPQRHFRRWLVAAILVALLVLLGWGLRLRASGPVDSGQAPDFRLTTFDGDEIALADLRGQVVIISFWASWCPPCRDEAAYLEATWRKYRDRGVTFVGVDYVDTEPNARAYLEEFNITYPNGPDLGQEIAHAFRIKGVPETYYVDKTGQLQGVKIGPLFPPELDVTIEELLAE